MRILVATTEAAALDVLLSRFRMVFAERLELEIVSGALYALSWLERQSADLIVSSEGLEDMSGHDLFDLVCDDATLRQVPFILLSDTGSELVLPDHHLILRAHADPTEVFAEAVFLLLVSGKLGEPAAAAETADAAASPADALRRRYESEVIKVSGTLEALTLFDLVISLGQGKQTGRLVVLVGATEGTFYLRGGRLRHATFADSDGEDAVQLIFAQVHHAPHTPFLFASGVPASTPDTVRTVLDTLLLQVAVTLDEQVGSKVTT